MKPARVLRASLLIFVILFAVMLLLSRSDQPPADGYLTVGFPLTFYTDLQNEGCLGQPLPNGRCCEDLCPPEFVAINLAQDAVLIYAASLVIGLGFTLGRRQ